jgi:phosphonoacetaldehyde hydrolase
MRIQAVIFDWAGTVVDYGCFAPVVVLERIFAQQGVPLEPAEARHGMGLLKVDQIREIVSLPRVAGAWEQERGQPPSENDVRRLFDAFIPLQMDVIEEYSNVIEGVPELVEKLRTAGVKIGSTTGYTRPMLDRLLTKAARQGYAPDAIVTPDAVGKGRPHPWMIFENLRLLDAYPPGRCLKVGDTRSDMEEGRNAGLITIGVTDSASDAVLEGAGRVRSILTEAGADHVIATAPDLWNIISEL